jgi:hypothetical protein
MHSSFQKQLNSLILHFPYDIVARKFLHLHISSLISSKEEGLVQIKMYLLHLISMFLLIYHFKVKVQNFQQCYQQL